MIKAILVLTDFRRAWVYYLGLSLVLGMALGSVISGPGRPLSHQQPVIGPVQLLPYTHPQPVPARSLPRDSHR